MTMLNYDIIATNVIAFIIYFIIMYFILLKYILPTIYVTYKLRESRLVSLLDNMNDPYETMALIFIIYGSLSSSALISNIQLLIEVETQIIKNIPSI